MTHTITNKDIKIIIVTVFHMFQNPQDLFNILSGYLEDIKKNLTLISGDGNYNVWNGRSTKILLDSYTWKILCVVSWNLTLTTKMECHGPSIKFWTWVNLQIQEGELEKGPCYIIILFTIKFLYCVTMSSDSWNSAGLTGLWIALLKTQSWYQLGGNTLWDWGNVP